MITVEELSLDKLLSTYSGEYLARKVIEFARINGGLDGDQVRRAIEMIVEEIQEDAENRNHHEDCYPSCQHCCDSDSHEAMSAMQDYASQISDLDDLAYEDLSDFSKDELIEHLSKAVEVCDHLYSYL